MISMMKKFSESQVENAGLTSKNVDEEPRILFHTATGWSLIS